MLNMDFNDEFRQFEDQKIIDEDNLNQFSLNSITFIRLYLITHLTQITCMGNAMSSAQYTRLLFDRGRVFNWSKLLEKYTDDFVIEHKSELGYHLYLLFEYSRVFESDKNREKCIASKLFEDMTQQDSAICFTFGLNVTEEGESSNAVGDCISLSVSGKVFHRGRLLELIRRYSYYIRNDSNFSFGVLISGLSALHGLILMHKCNAVVVCTLILELGYGFELLLVKLNMVLWVQKSDNCVTLKVLNSEGATSDCSKLFEKSSQKSENLWAVLILQMTIETDGVISQGLIAQLQVKDCRPQILMSVAWKVFWEIVTSTTGCHMLLLWDLETFMEYSILVFLFPFEFNLFFFGLRSIRRSISYVWMFIELLISHGSIVCGSSCWSVSWEENHILQLMNDTSVKMETKSNQTVCSCGCEVLKLCIKNVQHHPLMLLLPKKYEWRVGMHNISIEADEVVCDGLGGNTWYLGRKEFIIRVDEISEMLAKAS
ncbi:hypothetical protein MKW98_022544 [Papaver atlanticum]|uniref:Uncharacterized protein n=1 Tax=Papaver atlanticum TaxID=357466 RepID=A0AAD4SKC1_9MAGN|nr:hypothetical protein MKW98_022544 [Papaver atlanticum]